MMRQIRYRVFVEWSDEDESYVARVPAFPGIAAHGDTQGEAAAEAQVAVEAALEVLAEDGKAPPPEDISGDYSGQVRLRMPRSLHRALVEAANAEGVSLNTLMVSRLSATVLQPTRPRRRAR